MENKFHFGNIQFFLKQWGKLLLEFKCTFRLVRNWIIHLCLNFYHKNFNCYFISISKYSYHHFSLSKIITWNVEIIFFYYYYYYSNFEQRRYKKQYKNPKSGQNFIFYSDCGQKTCSNFKNHKKLREPIKSHIFWTNLQITPTQPITGMNSENRVWLRASLIRNRYHWTPQN